MANLAFERDSPRSGRAPQFYVRPYQIMIAPHESVLEGNWLIENSKMVADTTSRRIESLLASHLQKVASSVDGWSQLYLDPSDDRLWQLTYPQSEMHGGGPPKLEVISSAVAMEVYDYAN